MFSDLNVISNIIDHMFYHKWAALHSTSESGPRGFLQVDIVILSKGETPKFPVTEKLENDDIEG